MNIHIDFNGCIAKCRRGGGQSDIFPSFRRLEHIDNIRIIIRTFSSNIRRREPFRETYTFCRIVSNTHLCVYSDYTLQTVLFVTDPRQLDTSLEHVSKIFIIEDFGRWLIHDKSPEYGKILYLSKDRYDIMLDDNIQKCYCPEDPSRIIKVDSQLASSDEDYYIRLLARLSF